MVTDLNDRYRRARSLHETGKVSGSGKPARPTDRRTRRVPGRTIGSRPIEVMRSGSTTWEGFSDDRARWLMRSRNSNAALSKATQPRPLLARHVARVGSQHSTRQRRGISLHDPRRGCGPSIRSALARGSCVEGTEWFPRLSAGVMAVRMRATSGVPAWQRRDCRSESIVRRVL